MKKLFIIAAVTSVLASSAFAINGENNESFFDKNFYIKLEAGAIKFNRIKENSIGVKLKSKPTGTVGIGVGGYITDRVRADLTFGHAFNPTFKYSGTSTLPAFINGIGSKAFSNFGLLKISSNQLIQLGVPAALAPIFTPAFNKGFNNFINNPNSLTTLNQVVLNAITKFANQNNFSAAQIAALNNQYTNFVNSMNNSKYSNYYNLLTANVKDIKVATTVKRKSQVENVMVNGYFDLVDLSNIRLFAGAGVGLALLKEKISFNTTISANGKTLYSEGDSGKTKVAKNFAYALTLGAATKIADNVHTELSYTWKDFGKTKSIKYLGTEVGKTAYRSHSVAAGLRFDI